MYWFVQGKTKESACSKSDLPDQFPDSKMPKQNNWVLIHSSHKPTPQRLAFKQIHTRLFAAQRLLSDTPTSTSLHSSTSAPDSREFIQPTHPHHSDHK